MDSKVNIPLLRKAVEWAEAEAAKPPELCEWEQNWWSLSPQVRDERLQRALLAPDPDDYWDEQERRAYNKAPECGTCYCIAGYVAASSGETVLGYETEFVAADLLAIDDDEASRLFDADNSIADVRRIAEDIAGERL